MALTKIQKDLVDSVANLMGQNGGLYYLGLFLDLTRVNYPRDNDANWTTLRRVGDRYGLKNPSRGEIVYEALRRGDTSMELQMPYAINPQLSDLELQVLMAASRVLLRRAGYFKEYMQEVCKLTGLRETVVGHHLKNLRRKFNIDANEKAIVVALLTRIVNPYRLFGDLPPYALLEIMRSKSFTNSFGIIATGVPQGNLNSDEYKVANAFIGQIGLNGGLYWRGWYDDIVILTGKSLNSVENIVVNLSSKFSIHNRGEIFYAVSKLKNEPVSATIPPRVNVDFDEDEQQFVRQAARILLPTAGYYEGWVRDVGEIINYSESSVHLKVEHIVKKTQTKNLGQAITYFIAHNIISPELGLHINRTPALEAILNAAARPNQTIYALN